MSFLSKTGFLIYEVDLQAGATGITMETTAKNHTGILAQTPRIVNSAGTGAYLPIMP